MKSKAVIVCTSDGDMIAEYSSLTKAAMAYNTRHENMLYWIMNKLYRHDCFFYFKNPSDYDTSLCKYNYHVPKSVDDDIELDGSKYRIVRYEVRNKRECITPCPFRVYPKPLVGSGGCVSCPSFKGRNRKRHEVACSKSLSKQPIS